MAGGRVLASIVLAAGALGASAGAFAQTPLYTRTATQSCLLRLPHAVAGLPPVTPTAPRALFVYALTRDDESAAGLGPRPRAHTQLGVWSGDRTYQGIILSVFKSVPDARTSFKSVASLYGGVRIRNVVATWDQEHKASRRLRNSVFGCLRSSGPPVSKPPAPAAILATFTGHWGGHDRGMSIASSDRGVEFANASCCARVYGWRSGSSPSRAR